MSEGGTPFYVVGEDEAHRALAMALVDAGVRQIALQSDASWLDPDLVRRWSALIESDDVPEARRWGDIKATPKVRIHPFIDGAPCKPGARRLRAALVEHARSARAPGMVILMLDTDGDEQVLKGAEQVMSWVAGQSDLPPTVIGIPHRDAEAWFFAAPGIDGDRLADARQVLCFDPTREPERLTSGPNDTPTDAKRVFRFVLLEEGKELVQGRPESRPPSPDEADAWAARLAADIARLSTFKKCHLAGFVRGIETTLRTALREYLPSPRGTGSP